MWTFGKYGFTSAVAYDPTKDREKDGPFPKIVKQKGTHILLRARIKEDLVDVQKRVLPTMVIVEQPSADYSFRAVLPRSLFKKYLALMVDAIDYDSHFKEVAEKHGKGVSGSSRHSAMMKVWSAMAALQPHSPYGYSGGYGSQSWSGGKGASKSTVVGGSSKTTTTKTKRYGSPPMGYNTMDEFLDAYVESQGLLDYRAGGGPRKGFKKDDAVIGYFGTGVVLSVKENAGADVADLVEVKPDDSKKKTGHFMSNFLAPANLSEKYNFDKIVEPSLADGKDDDKDGTFDLLTMDEVFDILTEKHPIVLDLGPEDLKILDDDAFELVTRLEEAYGKNAEVTVAQITENYNEILWEGSSDEEKVKWAQAGDIDIPSIHEAEAIRLVLDAMDGAAENSPVGG